MGWLASLTLEDEARQELGLPRAVCEYEDIFSNELPGLPLHRDVDFTIELHPGTSPISMIRVEWRILSCKNSNSNYRNCWTGVLLDRAFHLEALRYCLPRRRTRPFDYA